MWLSENEMGSKEKTFISGGSGRQETKGNVFVLGQQEDAQTITTGTWLPRKPGSPACIQPDLKEVSSIVATKQGSSDPTSWEDIQKGETCRLQLLGVLKPPGPDNFPCVCISLSPPAWVIWGFFALIWSLSSQSGILGSRENLSPIGTMLFPSLCPWDLRGSRKHCVPEEQPVATRDHHYRSTVYENKAICACGFGACRLPTNGAECSPFQPSRHSHLPSLQVPCSMQRGWQTRWSQAAPVQPHSGRLPRCRRPWVPQSTGAHFWKKTMITAHQFGETSMGGQTTNMARVLELAQGPCVILGSLSLHWLVHSWLGNF